jgi:hypothetical protein
MQSLIDAEGFRIRVITPSLARSHENISTIPLLHNGATISGRTTIGEIKSQIAVHLGYSLGSEVNDQDDWECNCAFARQINERGIWRKLVCGRNVGTQDAEQSNHSCSFSAEGIHISISQPCVMCSRPLYDQQIGNIDSLNGICMAAMFIRTDTQCSHLLHGDCMQSGNPWICPPSCRSGMWHGRAYLW